MFSQSADGLAACFGRHYCWRIVPQCPCSWAVGWWGLQDTVPCRGQRAGTPGLRAVWLQTVLILHLNPSLVLKLSVLVLALLSIGPSTVLLWPCRAAPVCHISRLMLGPMMCVVRLGRISFKLVCLQVYAKALFSARSSCSVPLSCCFRSLAEMEGA